MRPVGRVGRAHGHDGSFYVERADHAFPVGTEVTVGGRTGTVERRAGTDERPLIRIAGVDPRELQREPLAVDEPFEEGEYPAEQLVGCEVRGVGRVTRVVNAPSCDVLEVGDVLIPFVGDAIVSVDVEARVIEVNREFLGLDP